MCKENCVKKVVQRKLCKESYVKKVGQMNLCKDSCVKTVVLRKLCKSSFKTLEAYLRLSVPKIASPEARNNLIKRTALNNILVHLKPPRRRRENNMNTTALRNILE